MNIAILSRSVNLYSTQSLIKAAQKRAHFVEVIDHTNCNLSSEKNRPSVIFEGERLLGIDAIIPRIGASVTAHGAAVVRQFELLNIPTTMRSEALLEARDKFRCLQTLAANGIDIPRTFLVGDTSELPRMLAILKFPMIIKLLESTHGTGVILAENQQTASSIIEAFHSRKEKVLLQEFIAEAAGEDIRAFVIGKEVVAAMKRSAQKDEFRSNLHRGATATSVALTAEEHRVAVHCAQLMGLHVAGVDFLRSGRGPLVMEVNASPGLEGIETYTGVDVAGKIIELVERKVKKAKSLQHYQAKVRR